MREVKAYIRHKRANEIVAALRNGGFSSMSIADVEGTGRYTKKGDMPSLRFPVTHSKMAKLEIVCKKEDVQEIVKIISKHGGTGEKGDGIINVSEVQQIFKVRTGKEDKQGL